MELVSENWVRGTGPGTTTSYTGTAGTTSSAISPNAIGLWIFCTSIAHVRVAKASASGGQTATTADFPVPASWPMKYLFDPGENDGTVKVSAIQSAAGGNLHVAPIMY